MSTRSQGYYRYPTIHGSTVVFVADDDLWSVDASGGVSRRLTANLAVVSHPVLSPDGRLLAFSGRDEGPSEVYVMPAQGGEARRLTYLGAVAEVVGWRGDRILFSSNAAQPMDHLFSIFEIGSEGGVPAAVPCGPARSIAIGDGGVVIGRNTGDLARWKRYRGGTVGNLWIDREKNGEFLPLISLEGNVARPMWVGERVHFMSDHEGIGNLYSCDAKGGDLVRHTDHVDFYVRNASSDGERIVYHAGADLYVWDGTESICVDFEFQSPGIQRSRRFCLAADFLEDHDLSSDGSHLAVVSRGDSYTGGTWEGAVVRQDGGESARCRLTRWLPGGDEVVLVCDRSGEDRLEVHSRSGGEPVRTFEDLDIGRPIAMKTSPVGKAVALTNHRNEIIRVDLVSGESTVVDRSRRTVVQGFDWSPDGRWLAYGASINDTQVAVHVHDGDTGEVRRLTEPILGDFDPVWDPKGRYLYFLSARVFDPVYDRLHFDLGFPKGIRPYLVTLSKDTPSPFVPSPKAVDPSTPGQSSDTDKKDIGESPEGRLEEAGSDAEKEESKKDGPPPVEIDFDRIEERVLPLPVAEGLYVGLAASESRVFFMVREPCGARSNRDDVDEGHALRFVDLESREEHGLVSSVHDYSLSGDRTALIYRHEDRLRVIRSGKDAQEPMPDSGDPGRKSGWVDLGRVRVSVEPRAEWSQMLREAWRLQRDYFWVEDMGGLDWSAVLHRYAPLVDRLASRSEFSDLLWEMQGELGTSHAYELGGDYRPHPHYRIGFLGADLVLDPEKDAYRIERIIRGDPWDALEPPPLLRPGTRFVEGAWIHAIGGQAIGEGRSPGEALLNAAGQEIELTVSGPGDEESRQVTVCTVRSETSLRFREWVESNRRFVHERSGGRVGYIHIPDMGPGGYAEFHRYFLVELERDGLVVDVRHNRGGHVSPLLLEKLARRRQGYRLTRWMGSWQMPDESPRGPVVALTNEYAGSDGDIFSHAFKLLKLGPLVGKRTWGGVIGIWPRNWLVDGTVTTQPEFASWFDDVGWNVENYGTDPDIEVELTPQDHVAGRDAQLERAVDEALAALDGSDNGAPNLGDRPSRSLPGKPKS